MFLKSIEIFGFKSFADKTTLVFKPGVTAIVGPNGCGKSNIVDAIKWVLGETNARSLRGEVMEDVIFSGSEARKPLGMAEVSITFVNEDNLLPVEYSEVTVTRRLYRSGESEYLINRNNVRLREIIELFTDTGIGKAAYSIMEQGNIDVILSNKPEERLSLFEEAAGINRYKLKIKDAYRNLQATEENLVRVNLIINEVEKELKTLEVQAQNAREYKNLKKEELEWETLYRLMITRDLEEKMGLNNGKIGAIKNSIDDKSKRLECINREVDNAFELVKETEKKVSGIKNKIYEKEKDCETINSKIYHYEERIAFLREEKRKKDEAIHRAESEKNALSEKLKALDRERENLGSLVMSQEEKLKSCSEEIGIIEERMGVLEKGIKNKTEQIRELEAGVERNRSALAEVINNLLSEIDGIRSRYEKKEIGTKKKAGEALKLVDELKSQLKHFSDKINDMDILTGREAIKIHRVELLSQLDDFENKLSFIKQALESVFRHEEEVYSALFGKDSLHSKKLGIEEEIKNGLESIESIKLDVVRSQEELDKYRKRKANLNEILNTLTPDIARNREKIHFLERESSRLKGEIKKIEDTINELRLDILSYEETEKKLKIDVKEMKNQIRSIESEVKSGRIEIEKLNSNIERLLNDIKKREKEADSLKSLIEKDQIMLEKLERENIQLQSRIDTIVHDFRESYNISLDMVDKEKLRGLTIDEINKTRESIRNRIAELGRVNLLAIEEYDEIKERYRYLITQKEDLEKARDDINLAIGKTLETARKMFLESFNKIKKNFNAIYRRLFGGGAADLYLTNESNIFESGVEIIVSPPGKTLKRRSLLSGGEKGLTAIALLFSIFMVKPSPFCILDEVDHDLDEENVMRFLKLLKEFTDSTQFIIITHNRRTIEFADIIYGVTSEEAGVSKVVSLDLMERNVG